MLSYESRKESEENMRKIRRVQEEDDTEERDRADKLSLKVYQTSTAHCSVAEYQRVCKLLIGYCPAISLFLVCYIDFNSRIWKFGRGFGIWF